ncbi:MAG: beta-lactamase family protein [Gammaproteobacteria bacterium]|nr:beta-lactamase family protein [Gammaproteobacteria bacterium]
MASLLAIGTSSSRQWLFMIGLLLVLFVQSGAQARTPAEIDAIVLDAMGRQNIAGMAVAIVRDNGLYYAKGYGYDDPAHTIPVTTSTLFRWGSLSKTLTATAALKLAEDNPAFSLEDRVIEHVDYWPRVGDKADIRIKHLLSNRSGITHYWMEEGCYGNLSPDFERKKHRQITYNARQAVEVFKDQDLCFSPGTGYKYSTFGFSLLGSAIEGASGVSYAGWVSRKIRQPLGMTSLQQATGTRGGFDEDRGRLEYIEEDNAAWRLPGGGWESNIIDLAKFANALVQGSLLNNTARLATSVPGNGTYGYGVFHSPGNTHVWHEGNNRNSRALLYLYPRTGERLGIVIMTNGRHSKPVEIVHRLAWLFIE